MQNPINERKSMARKQLFLLFLMATLLTSCTQKPIAATPQISAVRPITSTDGHTTGTFILNSPDATDEGTLPAEYTCNGPANTLALSWSGAPVGTKSFAVIMHHVASQTDIHWYWVVYNIPADVTSLPKNMTGIGTVGTNSVNDRQAYTPPCSKGPGPKNYSYTVYALSDQPQLSVPANQVTCAVLLDAIKDITLASAELHVTYSRK
jgi:Raf kinase inhibitor-like YbhB/YbcL family protein